MKKLLVLLTGGTLLMKASRPEPATTSASGARPKMPSLSLEELPDVLAEVPALGRVASIELRQLFSMDSSDMQPSDWVALGREVHAAVASPDVDGVLIVHGTDTMAYTASALALMLGPLPKPVVLTGSQRPLVDVRTDARENLVDAALVATLNIPEVSVTFSSHVLRGARATKRDAWGYDAFDSPNCAPLAQLGVQTVIAPHVRAPSTALAPFDDRLEPSVLAVRVFPGLDERLVSGALRTGVKGLVLEAYGAGNLPQVGRSLIPALEQAREANVPVVVVSQCLRGFVDLSRYGGGAAAAAVGAISGGDMTPEAALAKLMIGLGRLGPGPALRDYFAKSIIGERS